MNRRAKGLKLHFVGIGGIGMSGIAEVFLNQGFEVSGSDMSSSATTERLRKKGARVAIGHSPENVGEADVVVISSAVKDDNPEVRRARETRIPVIPRAEMLGELMRGQTGIAVAGTHGKTTTTSILATILTEADVDPTIVIGGIVNAFGANAKLGRGDVVVAEADESDGSFLHLPATYAVITNIDTDHLDHFGSVEILDRAFVDFVGKLPFYGVAAVCGEDPGVRRNLSRWTKPVVTYGFGEEWQFRAEDVRSEGLTVSFTVTEAGAEDRRERLGEFRLNVPGRHNVLNAVGAIVVARQMGIPVEKIQEGVSAFKGVKRRFEIIWSDEKSGRVIVDDYGHHPTEIMATLAAARTYWKGRILCVFQPHRYTRTMHCRDGFLGAFNQADAVLVTDIYAAGEKPIPGLSGEHLADEIRAAGSEKKDVAYCGELESAANAVTERIRDGDLVICLGAGSITRLPGMLKERLSK